MAFGLLTAGLSAIGGIGKIIQGFRQRKEAKNLKKSNFIPASMQEGLNRLKANASSMFLPGYGRAKENINQSTSNAIRAAGSGSISDKLSAAQSANINENDALVDLETKGAQFQLGNEDRLNQGLNQKANVEMENERTFRATKQQLLNSGSQNLFGGLTDLSTVGTTAMAGAFGSGLQSMKNKTPDEFINFYESEYDSSNYSPIENLEIKKLYRQANKQKGAINTTPEVNRIQLGSSIGAPTLPSSL